MNSLSRLFVKNDPLLRQVGMVVVYYHVFRIAVAEGWADKITRNKLLSFQKKRESNRETAEQNLAEADYDLLEFERFAQSPNDGYALRFRVKVLMALGFNLDISIDDLGPNLET